MLSTRIGFLFKKVYQSMANRGAIDSFEQLYYIFKAKLNVQIYAEIVCSKLFAFDDNGIGKRCAIRMLSTSTWREIAEKRGRKQAKKSRQGEEKRGEDVRRQSETWMRDIGMQIGDTGRAWWIQWTRVYVSKPGTDKNCSLTIWGGDTVAREKISSTKFSSPCQWSYANHVSQV